jgi:hypothetical protein
MGRSSFSGLQVERVLDGLQGFVPAFELEQGGASCERYLARVSRKRRLSLTSVFDLPALVVVTEGFVKLFHSKVGVSEDETDAWNAWIPSHPFFTRADGWKGLSSAPTVVDNRLTSLLRL